MEQIPVPGGFFVRIFLTYRVLCATIKTAIYGLAVEK